MNSNVQYDRQRLLDIFAYLSDRELEALGRHYVESACDYGMSSFVDSAAGCTCSHTMAMNDFYTDRLRLFEEFLGAERFNKLFGELVAARRAEQEALERETPPYGSRPEPTRVTLEEAREWLREPGQDVAPEVLSPDELAAEYKAGFRGWYAEVVVIEEDGKQVLLAMPDPTRLDAAAKRHGFVVRDGCFVYGVDAD